MHHNWNHRCRFLNSMPHAIPSIPSRVLPRWRGPAWGLPSSRRPAPLLPVREPGRLRRRSPALIVRQDFTGAFKTWRRCHVHVFTYILHIIFTYTDTNTHHIHRHHLYLYIYILYIHIQLTDPTCCCLEASSACFAKGRCWDALQSARASAPETRVLWIPDHYHVRTNQDMLHAITWWIMRISPNLITSNFFIHTSEDPG